MCGIPLRVSLRYLLTYSSIFWVKLWAVRALGLCRSARFAVVSVKLFTLFRLLYDSGQSQQSVSWWLFD